MFGGVFSQQQESTNSLLGCSLLSSSPSSTFSPSSRYFHHHRRVCRFLRRHKWKTIALLSSAGISFLLLSALKRRLRHFREVFDNETTTSSFLIPAAAALITGVDQTTIIDDQTTTDDNLLVQLGIGSSREWKITLYFCRNQQLSDSTASTLLTNKLRPHLLALDNVDYYLAQLRDNPTGLAPAEKEAYFKELQALTFARFVLVVVSAALTLLGHRLEVNFIGRQMFDRLEHKQQEEQEEEDSERGEGRRSVLPDANVETNYAYLTSTQTFMSPSSPPPALLCGLPLLAQIVNIQVRKTLNGAVPESVFSMDRLRGMVGCMVSQVIYELYKQNNTGLVVVDELQIVSVMLPEQQEQLDAVAGVPTTTTTSSSYDGKYLCPVGVCIVDSYLSVTRDYLESPLFRSSLTATTQMFCHLSMQLLAEKLAPKWKPPHPMFVMPQAPKTPNTPQPNTPQPPHTPQPPPNTPQPPPNTPPTPQAHRHVVKRVASPELLPPSSCSVVPPPVSSNIWAIRATTTTTDMQPWMSSRADAGRGEFLLARCLGRLCHIAGEAVSPSSGCHDGWMKEFTEIEEVKELSRVVYFARVDSAVVKQRVLSDLQTKLNSTSNEQQQQQSQQLLVSSPKPPKHSMRTTTTPAGDGELLELAREQAAMICSEGLASDRLRRVRGVEELLTQLEFGIADYEKELRLNGNNGCWRS
eukprot:GHVS01056521.1.p1 GENE.GHVS01056521.1~~GHVS01056521.1.p1  ORF type:complete len:696 (-),score=175.75 GHVS01056521.1:99-2186(-)